MKRFYDFLTYKTPIFAVLFFVSMIIIIQWICVNITMYEYKEYDITIVSDQEFYTLELECSKELVFDLHESYLQMGNNKIKLKNAEILSRTNNDTCIYDISVPSSTNISLGMTTIVLAENPTSLWDMLLKG